MNWTKSSKTQPHRFKTKKWSSASLLYGHWLFTPAALFSALGALPCFISCISSQCIPLPSYPDWTTAVLQFWFLGVAYQSFSIHSHASRLGVSKNCKLTALEVKTALYCVLGFMCFVCFATTLMPKCDAPKFRAFRGIMFMILGVSTALIFVAMKLE